MANVFNKFSYINSYYELGYKFFLLGTFFLPSALPISVFLYLLSSIISVSLNKILINRSNLNYPLLICSGIIIFATFNVTFFNKPEILDDYNLSNIWINLLNWLPVTLFYFTLKSYLISFRNRLAFAKFIICGTVPVIVSMILQKFFNIYGPFETLFGSIVWFQKPLFTDNLGVSGLFSNANYTGSWLILILPFSFLLVNYSKRKKFKISCFIILILINYMILLTASRNALMGLLINFILLFGIKNFFKKSSFLIPFVSIIYILGLNVNLGLNKYLPIKIIDRIINIFDYPRSAIWQSALNNIQERPIFGWGGSTFSLLHYENNYNLGNPETFINAQHTHNVFLELAYNYGLPLSIILCLTIISFLLRSIKLNYFSDMFSYESFANKVWLSTLVIFFVTHNFDITFYDGKISILVSLLFAGNSCIIKELENKKHLVN